MATKTSTLRWIYETYPAAPGPLVLGHGPDRPLAIVVGDAPAEDDDAGPFTGRAGALLRGLMTFAGLPPQQCWFTYVVKRGDGPTEPRDSEVGESLPYLWRELDLAGGDSCKVVIALGRIAAAALTGDDGLKVGKARGTWRVVRDPAGVKWAVFVTVHPGAALRRREAAEELAQDLRAAAAQVDLYGPQAAQQLGG